MDHSGSWVILNCNYLIDLGGICFLIDPVRMELLCIGALFFNSLWTKAKLENKIPLCTRSVL